MSAAPAYYPVETALDLSTGLHRAVPDAVYHRKVLGLASKSALDRFARSPAHYLAWLRGAETDETPALHLGKAVHCAMLEPARFDREYIAEPEWGPCRANAELGVSTEQGRENKKRRDAWRAARAGAPTLTVDEARSIRGMVASVLAHPLASRMLEQGDAEVTLRWLDQPSGLACKARLDWLVPSLSMIADIKSTQDASPDGFRRSVAKYGYHRQDAFYRDGMRAIGAPVEHFAFVACEKEAPYAVAVYSLDVEAITAGERQTRRLLDSLAACCARGQFPGYPDTIHTLSLPPWITE